MHIWHYDKKWESKLEHFKVLKFTLKQKILSCMQNKK